MWAGHPDRVPPGTLALRGLEEPFFQLFCCVVLVFGSCGNKVFDLLSVCWVRGSGDYDQKKKDTVVCLAGCAVVLCQFLVLARNWQFFCCSGKFSLRPEKKSSSSLSGGYAINYNQKKKYTGGKF